jgi:hypothetical protein
MVKALMPYAGSVMLAVASEDAAESMEGNKRNTMRATLPNEN